MGGIADEIARLQQITPGLLGLAQIPGQLPSQGLTFNQIASEQLVRSIDQSEDGLRQLELLTALPSFRTPNPAALRMLRDFTKVMAATLSYLVTMVETGVASLTPAYKEHLYDLVDRADELIDTLAWGAEAHEELGELVRQEACGSLQFCRRRTAALTHAPLRCSGRTTRPSRRTSMRSSKNT